MGPSLILFFKLICQSLSPFIFLNTRWVIFLSLMQILLTFDPFHIPLFSHMKCAVCASMDAAGAVQGRVGVWRARSPYAKCQTRVRLLCVCMNVSFTQQLASHSPLHALCRFAHSLARSLSQFDRTRERDWQGRVIITSSSSLAASSERRRAPARATERCSLQSIDPATGAGTRARNPHFMPSARDFIYTRRSPSNAHKV